MESLLYFIDEHGTSFVKGLMTSNAWYKVDTIFSELRDRRDGSKDKSGSLQTGLYSPDAGGA